MNYLCNINRISFKNVFKKAAIYRMLGNCREVIVYVDLRLSGHKN